MKNKTITGETWTKTHTEEIGSHWARADGAVVKKHEGYSSRPWLPNHRSWLAYAPGKNFPLSFKRKNSRGFVVSRSFKTAENAMRMLDREYPQKEIK